MHKVYTIFSGLNIECYWCAQNIEPRNIDITSTTHFKEVLISKDRFLKKINFPRIMKNYEGRKSSKTETIPDKVYKYLEDQIDIIKL